MNTPAPVPQITAKEEHQAKLQMTLCDTAKSYAQISSAALALPLLFRQAVFGKDAVVHGLPLHRPCLLYAAWFCFLVAIGFGLLYQWASIRRVWDQFHDTHRTPENASKPGYRKTRWVVNFGDFNLSAVWVTMTLSFYIGAIFFTVFAASNL
jgi:hypothetical protein